MLQCQLYFQRCPPPHTTGRDGNCLSPMRLALNEYMLKFTPEGVRPLACRCHLKQKQAEKDHTQRREIKTWPLQGEKRVSKGSGPTYKVCHQGKTVLQLVRFKGQRRQGGITQEMPRNCPKDGVQLHGWEQPTLDPLLCWVCSSFLFPWTSLPLPKDTASANRPLWLL